MERKWKLPKTLNPKPKIWFRVRNERMGREQETALGFILGIMENKMEATIMGYIGILWYILGLYLP